MPQFFQPINHTSATLALDEDTHAGTTVLLNKADGITVTLPVSVGKGAIYKFFVGTTFTSDGIIKVTTTDIMQGGVAVSTDAAGVTVLTAATSDTLTMNGSTSGGLKGSFVEFEDVSAGIWKVSGFLISTGAEATPFSATVS